MAADRFITGCFTTYTVHHIGATSPTDASSLTHRFSPIAMPVTMERMDRSDKGSAGPLPQPGCCAINDGIGICFHKGTTAYPACVLARDVVREIAPCLRFRSLFTHTLPDRHPPPQT